MMVKAGTVCAALGLALLVGGMVFFGGIVAPLVFTTLPGEVAGPFIRGMFPFYFGYLAVGAGVSGAGFLVRRERGCAAAMGVVLVAVLWAWLWLIPHLDEWRAAGDWAAFDRGHKVSTWLNGAELLAAVWLLVRVVLK
jgi:hypothetical protein